MQDNHGHTRQHRGSSPPYEEAKECVEIRVKSRRAPLPVQERSLTIAPTQEQIPQERDQGHDVGPPRF